MSERMGKSLSPVLVCESVSPCTVTASGSEEEGGEGRERRGSESEGEEGGGEDEEEVEWRSLQDTMKAQQLKKKERGNKDSHTVHCPFFPDVSAPHTYLTPLTPSLTQLCPLL